MLITLLSNARTITGKITDSTGEPLLGATIMIKGTSKFTSSDFDGNYSIKAKDDDILVFSFAGYTAVQIKVEKRTVINISMQGSLDTVVIQGYRTVNKKTSKVASHTVTSQEIINKPNASFVQKLQGQVAGLNIQTTTGQPGTNNSVQLRGVGSIISNTEPLLIIDGVPIDEDKFKSLDPNSISSYSNVRRMINNGQHVTPHAVKIEEMINYFDYKYPQPIDEHPFSINTEVSKASWNKENRVVRIGLQGKEYNQEELPASNLTFLLDVSGSMSGHNKLPLLKKAFGLLVNQMREQDYISIVVYAGSAGVVLPPTSGANKESILKALNNLQSGGSTAGGAGIELAYKLAQENFVKNGNNRVILATDGDFNVGINSTDGLESLIEEKRKTGVYLSVLGFGYGNYKDEQLETLADTGNGNHAYIDTMQEAQKVFGKEFGGTLYTIAKDVKIQIEFNPALVSSYRLIGYENRLLNNEDFVNDTIDAGELGSGHTVTALYEISPVNKKDTIKQPELKYQNNNIIDSYNDELFTVKFRYKKPNKKKSIEMIHVQKNKTKKASSDMNFATAVALFGMQLRKSAYDGNTTTKDIIKLAEKGLKNDKYGYRAEFIRLVKSSNNQIAMN